MRLLAVTLAALWALAGWAQSITMDTEPLTITPGAVLGSTARIKWRVQKQSGVLLQVFDAAGKCVRTVYASRMAPNDYSVIYDGRDGKGQMLPPGEYTVRLSANPTAEPDLAFGAGGMLGQVTLRGAFQEARKLALGATGFDPKSVTLKVNGEIWERKDDFDAAGKNFKVDAAAGTIELNPAAELRKGAEIAVTFTRGLALENPWAIQAAPDGSVYIADNLYGLDQANKTPKPRIGKVYKVDAAGKPVGNFGQDGVLAYQCQDLEVDAEGRLYVAPYTHFISVFDAQGKRLYNVAGYSDSHGKGKDLPYRGGYWPKGIALNDARRMVIVNGDRTNVIYDATRPDFEGYLACQTGEEGASYPPVMWQYLGPCVTALGDFYYQTTAYNNLVKYHYNREVDLFSLVWQTPTVSPGPDIKLDGPAQTWHAMGLEADGTGLLYVADRHNHRIQIYFDAGNTCQHVGSIGSKGAAVEKGQLMAPHAVTISPDGRTLYIADDGISVKFGNNPVVTGASRVVKWKLGAEETVEAKLTVK